MPLYTPHARSTEALYPTGSTCSTTVTPTVMCLHVALWAGCHSMAANKHTEVPTGAASHVVVLLAMITADGAKGVSLEIIVQAYWCYSCMLCMQCADPASPYVLPAVLLLLCHVGFRAIA